VDVALVEYPFDSEQRLFEVAGRCDMAVDEGRVYGWDSPIERPDGVTHAERYLKRIGDRSFLSLWCHAGVYRDEGKVGPTGHGKEVADLLVVFENHVIIFSDKDCKYPNSDKPLVNWGRWYRRAVKDAADQLYGGERWIRRCPERLFLDRACTHRFPVQLPPPGEAKFHRVVVAHGASRACREALGGSGSLLIAPFVVGDMHYQGEGPEATFFTIGRVDPSRGYVHVFDDCTLGVVMSARDTITDFVAYLTKKESLIESGRLRWAAGEEDLLAYYLGKLNADGEHDFVFPADVNGLRIDQGLWEAFCRSPERLAQIQADGISYLWDNLIERFSHHFLNQTSHYNTHSSYAEEERLLRTFAREPRVRRRMLAKCLVELVEKGSGFSRLTRVVLPSGPGDPYYVFMALQKPPGVDQEEYREVRRSLLGEICGVVKVKFPDAQDIAGIATEPGPIDAPTRSEDAVWLDARVWTPENDAYAASAQEELGLLVKLKESRANEREYPVP
jgi:hypothetical protein